MTQKTSVVTTERFAKGLTYQEFLAQAKVNLEQFHKWYNDFNPNPDDLAFFRRAMAHPRGPGKVLALAEDWCPDVYRGLPVMAKVAEAVGLELKVFPRDLNLDIMDEFLYQGQYRSIPTFVFYTKNMEYLCHWIERPALANRETAEVTEQLKREMPGAKEEDIRAERRKRLLARWPAWQQETVREIRHLLAQTLQIPP
ncbi:MAG: thioredoxin family protein [Dehalococcoidia bacterium]